MIGKQCRPWSDVAVCDIWSWSKQFAQAGLAVQFLGLLKYIFFLVEKQQKQEENKIFFYLESFK